MPQNFTIQLKSWKQVVVAIVVLALAIGGYSAFLQKDIGSELPKIMEARLRADLGSEVARSTLPLDNRDASPTPAEAEKFVEKYRATERAKIVAIDTRGLGSSIVVRIKFILPGSDAEQIRYYRVKHGWLTGWYVWDSVTEAAWQTGWL